MKKFGSVFVLVLVFLLTACGGGGGSSSPPEFSEIPLNQVQISESRVTGVPRDNLIAYLQEMAQGPWGPPEDRFGVGYRGFFLWEGAPVVRTETGTSPERRRMAERAVDQLNDWLPVENRMIMGDPSALRPQTEQDVPDGEIHISFRYAESGGTQRPNTVTRRDPESGRVVTNMASSLIEISPDDWGSHALYGVIVHELIHAVGLEGHVFEGDHPNTLLPDTGSLPDEAGLLDIPRIDGEALMTIYSRYTRGEGRDDINPTSLGPWATGIPAISANIRTEGGSVSFGAEYRSQWIRAWDKGPMPSVPLSRSGITGTATWNGDLIGYTDNGISARGDAEITIEMQTMIGGAQFSSITSGGSPWGADLSYSVSVDGNYLTATDTSDSLTGQFRGSGHEAVTGALAINNLTAAFGATRQ